MPVERAKEILAEHPRGVLFGSTRKVMFTLLRGSSLLLRAEFSGIHDTGSALDLSGEPTASRQGLSRGDDHPTLRGDRRGGFTIDKAVGGNRKADHVRGKERAPVHALFKLRRHSRRHPPDPGDHQRADHREATREATRQRATSRFPNTMEFSISGNIGAQLFGGHR